MLSIVPLRIVLYCAFQLCFTLPFVQRAIFTQFLDGVIYTLAFVQRVTRMIESVQRVN